MLVLLLQQLVRYCEGIYHVSSGLMQLATVWCAGEPAHEGTCTVRIEHCRSVLTSTHGAVTASLRCCVSYIGPETSGVQECMCYTRVVGLKIADVPYG